MRVKDVRPEKIIELLKETDDDLYLISITFDGNNPILNLYKPWYDTEKRKEKQYELCEEYQKWVKKMDKYFKDNNIP